MTEKQSISADATRIISMHGVPYIEVTATVNMGTKDSIGRTVYVYVTKDAIRKALDNGMWETNKK